MIQIVGDGSFYFNVPSSVYGASKQYKLPILSIVLDNGGWSAVKESTLRVYPDGDAKVEDEFAANLPADVDFSKVGGAFGAYGEKVTDPAAVPAALDRAIKEVKGGRTAVLHVGTPGAGGGGVRVGDVIVDAIEGIHVVCSSVENPRGQYASAVLSVAGPCVFTMTSGISDTLDDQTVPHGTDRALADC